MNDGAWLAPSPAVSSDRLRLRVADVPAAQPRAAERLGSAEAREARDTSASLRWSAASRVRELDGGEARQNKFLRLLGAPPLPGSLSGLVRVDSSHSLLATSSCSFGSVDSESARLITRSRESADSPRLLPARAPDRRGWTERSREPRAGSPSASRSARLIMRSRESADSPRLLPVRAPDRRGRTERSREPRAGSPSASRSARLITRSRESADSPRLLPARAPDDHRGGLPGARGGRLKPRADSSRGSSPSPDRLSRALVSRRGCYPASSVGPMNGECPPGPRVISRSGPGVAGCLLILACPRLTQFNSIQFESPSKRHHMVRPFARPAHSHFQVPAPQVLTRRRR